ncbi:MAG: TonB-dependent receptor [Candidatus Electryonea clarkiae]|nr:TonB-dependent receptor [Candidatus Electryonea clarkiae]MDP8285117.1 TonB-dependent receptor [Candidatus Electryonea clarkiae]
MRGRYIFVLFVLVLCAGFLLPGIVFAQATTGKIAGKVTDKSSDEPIINANVVIEGSSQGAATDLDGYFVIIAVRPGRHTIKVTSIGYHPYSIEDVFVKTDGTTDIEIEMTQSTMKLEEVILVYKKPQVDIKTVSSVHVISADDIRSSAVEDVTALITSLPGIKLDEEGKIHIRGGRETEARFVVDGMDSRDPITGEILPLNLSAMNIQEISILTGGMSAEYGQATSGVITITTPEGDIDSYNGAVEWFTDRYLDNSSFNQDRTNAAFGGPVPFTKSLGGRPLTFYLTTNTNLSDTYTPLGVTYDPENYVGLGMDMPRRQFNDWSGSLKMAYDMGRGRKMSLYMNERSRLWDLFPQGFSGVPGSYTWQYKYNLAYRPQAMDRRSSAIVDFANQVSAKTVFNVSLGRQVLNASISPGIKNPGEFTLIDEIEENYTGQINDSDQNNNGVWDQDADNDGVVHSDIYDELGFDQDGNNFRDGFFDSNRNYIYEGGGEGYEDLNMNGKWDRGEDWIDLNGNGIYDYAEPWTDRSDPVTGINNTGVWDPWDPYVDLNSNGVWDPAEPQLQEQDLNLNGRWDGERFQDSNGNKIFDRWEPFDDENGNFAWDDGERYTDFNGDGKQNDGEGYDDINMNGHMDRIDLVDNDDEDTDEPFWDGDFYYDTGEPFIDLPDPVTGLYNGRWDVDEQFWDLPSSNSGLLFGTEGSFFRQGQLGTATLNGVYDAPNGFFDEYELFTAPSGDVQRPVSYTWDLDTHGAEWVYDDFMKFYPNKSTWTNRTLHDQDLSVRRFDAPNFVYDEGQEKYIDYNGNGTWNGQDLFLNPGRWDNAAVWQKRRTEEYSFKASWQSQVHKFHDMKAGVEAKYRIMSQQYISSPDQEYTGEAELSPDQPWADRGSVRDFWTYRPWSGAMYIQDKMEFEGLIVQSGMRSDFVIHDKKVVDEQKRRFDEGEPGAIEAERYHFQFAPRLGISHPITAQSKLYFNYGHFYQTPAFSYFYQSTTTNIDAGTVGNPNLKFEKTVTYELGVHTQITNTVSFQIAGYYRDMYDLISTVAEKTGPITIYRYINLDYGRARGMEIKIDKNFADHYQFNLNYDFSYAYGKASGANDEFERRSLNVPVNYDEHPLGWDETHRVTLNGAVMYGKKEYPYLFGFRVLDYWLLSVQWQFGSGRPYSPSQYSTGINPNLILENSARMPWTETTTVRFEKYFDIAGVKTIWGITVNNVWDKRNWNSIYTQTGSPIYAIHPLNPDYNPFVDRSEFDANPRNYSPGRQIFFKVGMEF